MPFRAVLMMLTLLASLLSVAGAAARAADGHFTTSDGVRLHYIEAGRGRTVVMVPGWTMPAWIFNAQITDLSRYWHVVALDPRSQGDSEIAASGHEPYRRGRDIAELLDHLGAANALLLGWSLGVLDVLSYVHQYGDSRLAGLVLVDNSIGEEPAPAPVRQPRIRRGRPIARDVAMRSFVRGMFVVPPPPGYVDRLTQAALRTPPDVAAELLAYPVPRSFWKDAVYSTAKPVLYIVRPGLSAQAANLAANHPNARTVVLRHIGHAMFVDDPPGFDAIVTNFVRQRVWP